MAYLDVDLTYPIALLVSALVGVMIVRFAVQRGDARAKARTQRVLARHGVASRANAPTEPSETP